MKNAFATFLNNLTDK